jgi:Ni2+-binding GTPase involved in maturation of urease and hydrogenase
MMKRIRFVMIGGFLGAGKTTTLARLARLYQARGQRVGLVTNDQAADLVDTSSLRQQGFAVQEVAGACFCCRFSDLVGCVARLEESQRPDVILAEPVGSCTDLVATVVQPLKELSGDRLEVAPYAVLFKPSHGLKILRNEENAGFSAKAAYIFLKQLEEADAIALNRIDELTSEQVETLAALIATRFPGTPLLRMSARTGAGVEALAELLDRQGAFGRKILDIDYDTYAEGEAELGWLNSIVQVRGEGAFEMDNLLLGVVRGLAGALPASGAEVAHLKVIGLSDAAFGVANVVSNGSQPELSLPSRARVTGADLVVNARVALDPGALEEALRQVVGSVCAALHLTPTFGNTQSFRPGRPTPTHRYASARV